MADLDKDSVISKTELKKDSKKIQEFGRRISELTINNIEAFKFPSNKISGLHEPWINKLRLTS